MREGLKKGMLQMLPTLESKNRKLDMMYVDSLYLYKVQTTNI